MTLTIQDLRLAGQLADNLRLLRAMRAALREDSGLRVSVRAWDLSRTYGVDRQAAAATVSKTGLLALLADEEAELVGQLADLGVTAADEERP